MRFYIIHKIRFEYSRPVFIEPTLVRLKPRSDNRQKLIAYELKVQPQAQSRAETVDLEGNNATWLNFSGVHERMTLEAVSETETLGGNPFDFLFPEARYSQLPMIYSETMGPLLEIFRKPNFQGPGLQAYAREQSVESQGKALDFLVGLTERVHRDFEKVYREEGEPLNPEQLIKLRKGACRDLTWFFLEVCRQTGLAGRYVSGYTRGDDRLLDRELHAWAEIYLPGGGWRGFDPTLGLAVSDHHVALAASVDPSLTLPTEGTFRGTGARSDIQFEVRIRVEES